MQHSQPVPLNIEVSHQQLTFIINVLAERPYREVAPLIQHLVRQQGEQLQPHIPDD